MLCGRDWYEKHKNDYTEAEIAALGMEIKVDGRKVSTIKKSTEDGVVKAVMKRYLPKDDKKGGER